MNGFDDHIRNRFTHTLEVAQISQTIARSMEFNGTPRHKILFINHKKIIL